MMAVMMAAAVSASAMNISDARRQALFLTDKMAYELGLNDAQYEAAYEINLDYFLCVDRVSDLFGKYWNRRNSDLAYVLTAAQYGQMLRTSYFYRPLSWQSGAWVFGIYSVYSNPNRYYRSAPRVYASYRGGNSRVSGYYASRDFGNGSRKAQSSVAAGRSKAAMNHSNDMQPARQFGGNASSSSRSVASNGSFGSGSHVSAVAGKTAARRFNVPSGGNGGSKAAGGHFGSR